MATLWAAGDEGGGGRKASSRPIELRWSLPVWLQADDDGAWQLDRLPLPEQ